VFNKPEYNVFVKAKSMPNGHDQGITTTVKSQGNGVAGVAVRFSGSGDTRQGYICVINNNQFGCFAVIADKFTSIQGWTTSDVIKAGQGNTMLLVVEGSTLTLQINGQQVAKLNDTRITSGFPTLYVESTKDGPGGAVFGPVKVAVVP
jgi:hypothetical protein